MRWSRCQGGSRRGRGPGPGRVLEQGRVLGSTLWSVRVVLVECRVSRWRRHRDGRGRGGTRRCTIGEGVDEGRLPVDDRRYLGGCRCRCRCRWIRAGSGDGARVLQRAAERCEAECALGGAGSRVPRRGTVHPRWRRDEAREGTVGDSGNDCTIARNKDKSPAKVRPPSPAKRSDDARWLVVGSRRQSPSLQRSSAPPRAARSLGPPLRSPQRIQRHDGHPGARAQAYARLSLSLSLACRIVAAYLTRSPSPPYPLPPWTALPFVYQFAAGAIAGVTELLCLYPLGAPSPPPPSPLPPSPSSPPGRGFGSSLTTSLRSLAAILSLPLLHSALPCPTLDVVRVHPHASP